MSIFSKDTGLSADLLKTVRAVMSGEELEESVQIDEKMSSKEKMKKGLYNQKMDPVGQEDDDVDNDGDSDKSDEYLKKRRKAIKKSMKDDEEGNDDAVKVNDSKQEQKEAADLDAANVDKALKHDCATHVEHAEHGAGQCIPGMHTLEEDENGERYVTHYDVMFQGEDGPFIVENVSVEEMKVIKSSMHGHSRKKK